MNIEHKIRADVLIVTALAEELQALESIFDLDTPSPSQDTTLTYYINEDFKSNSDTFVLAALCLNSMGNAAASGKVAVAIKELNPSYVFMFGLAGGYKKETKLTDVIVSDKLFYRGLRKQYPDRAQIRPEPLRGDALLEDRLRAYHLQIKDGRQYTVKFGTFVIDEAVIQDEETVENLHENYPKLIGFEMESFGVGYAASLFQENVKGIAPRYVYF